MDKYCAFLRGVNVNGKTMKMEDARSAFEMAGMTDVVSVLASGNIVFSAADIAEAAERPQDTLRKLLEQALSARFGSQVSLFVKNADEVADMLSSSPFAEDPDSQVYVFICEPGFERILLDEFGKIVPAGKEFAEISGGFFYWQCAKGMTLDSGFSKILGRKNMKEKFTSRNLNTIAKVSAKMSMAHE